MKQNYNLLITGVSGTNTGTQILTAAKLAERYTITTTDIAEESYGKYNSDTFYKVPRANDPDYLEALKDVCHKEEIRILIPGSEPELNVLSQHREMFESLGITVLINNTSVIGRCMDKLESVRFLKENGFCYAESCLFDPQDIAHSRETILDSLLFPVVVKPYLNSGGSKNIHIIQDEKELGFVLDLLRTTGATSMMAQEFVGTHEEEYTLGVMSGSDGRPFSAFALKRLINNTLTQKINVKNQHTDRIKGESLVISTGISQGHVGDFPEAREFAREVASKIGSTGPLNIQCRKTDRGFVAFEINPRFSGTTSIRAMCGHNDVDMMVRSVLEKEKVGQATYKEGLVLRTLENCFIEGKHP